MRYRADILDVARCCRFLELRTVRVRALLRPSHVIYGFMPLYDPIDIGVPLQASRSDLVAFKWAANGIAADFILPDDDAHLLRVSFDKPCIIRLLDEMPLSTEEDDTPKEGLVPEHFAYRLENAVFARSQSPAWKIGAGPVTHYQFVTGWACMDVLTAAAPQFTFVPRS